MSNKLKHLVGQPQDSNVKIASLTNLMTVKGNYVASGFNIDIKDLSGKEIARFQISGENFDESIDTLVEGIAKDLRAAAQRLKSEISIINDAVGNK